MKRRMTLALGVPLLMMASQPASAAEDMVGPAFADRHTAAFAGIQVRMNIGERRPAAPTARLRLSYTQYSGDARSGLQPHHGSSFELGLARGGGADLFLGGQRLADLRQRLGISPVAIAFVAAGAVVVGAVVVSELDKEQCLLPEKELCGPQPQE